MNRSALVSKCVAGVGCALATLAAGSARAEPPAPVDVVVKEAAPPGRALTIEYNPLALFIGRVSASVVIAPVDHHALVLTPFYAVTTTEPIYVFDASTMAVDVRLPKQKFEGFGGELGYRYYGGLGGPRGLFVGPSLMLASITATPENGSAISFFDFAFAVDVGYEALLADRIAVTLGAGAEYCVASKSLPDQQLPASVYANSSLRPRLLAAVGYAF
jgi:hypothetical protein